ncbi:DUF3307 domain-containing protein [Tropicimonas isoalkanivorans]|uniref:DUF3307 domain-containing protein n=1 Tax=Tropicimonas isoalkanivorans TaxID=441112 RepID=A0A1I1FXY4_9RHOB|nr:DUF3307 domain-containing protein [Tropicimonas isoalkanivorans]SFC04204.1 Protein of unknown function [Tropicimonas isoalkanivorans]
MTETLSALLLAHALADFVFQTGWMVTNKSRPHVLLLHGAIVFALGLLAVGQFWAPVIGVLALLHIATDALKLRFGDDGLRAYLLDQAAHTVAILAVALIAPTLFQDGWWPGLLPDPYDPWLPTAMAWVAGMILAVRAGGFAVAKLLAPYATFWNRYAVFSGSLPNAGRMIGELERGLTYVLITAGQPTGVAFLIAAKSVLRFNATKDDRKIAEYVIIGTLASVGWALLVAFAAHALIGRLIVAAP